MIRLIAATLASLSFAVPLLLPRDALACSGGGASGSDVAPATGWTWLKPSLAPNPSVGTVSIATDGFFVIDAEGNGLTAGDAASSMQVVVTDGKVELLLDRQLGWYFFGWSATSPLPLGARLFASLRATPIAPGAAGQVGGQFPLVVVAEPSSLAEPLPAFGDWFDFYRGREGATVSCEAATWGCLPERMLSIPLGFDRALAAQVIWNLPELAGGGALRAISATAVSSAVKSARPNRRSASPLPTLR